jgi:hypothetical protein
MIIRNDIKSNATVVPKSLKDTLLRVGGTNPYGEPMFRLVRAEDRISRAAGEWNRWAEDLSVDDRGGLGINDIQKMLLQLNQVLDAAERRGLPKHEIEKIARDLGGEMDEVLNSRLSAVPQSVDIGMADVEVYPYEGWILEKWKPAERCGSPEIWESYRFRGEAALGPFPQHGEYDLLSGPTPYMPDATQLEEAVRQNFRDIESRPRSARERVYLMMARADARRKQLAKEQNDRADAFRKDGPASLRNRLSLGAGRVIQEMAKKAGLVGHYGN